MFRTNKSHFRIAVHVFGVRDIIFGGIVLLQKFHKLRGFSLPDFLRACLIITLLAAKLVGIQSVRSCPDESAVLGTPNRDEIIIVLSVFRYKFKVRMRFSQAFSKRLSAKFSGEAFFIASPFCHFIIL